MLNVKQISQATRLRVLRVAPPLPAAVNERVEALWQMEHATRAGKLFNGSILSVTLAGEDLIEGEISEYRRLLAQRADPALVPILAIRPLAVSGLLRCADGIVFGSRGRGNTEAAGQWELAPSGGIDATALVPGSSIDPAAQVLTELREELGVPATVITELTMFCIVEDTVSSVIDLGILLSAPALKAADILALHQRSASREYNKIRIVSDVDLSGFIADEGSHVEPVSLALLAARRLG